MARPNRIVVLGFLSHFPVAGVAWQTLHYLVGFRNLGYDVYYVEAHGCTPSKLMQHDKDDGARRAAGYIEGLMRRVGLENRWAYHSLYDSRCFGLSQFELKNLYSSAAFLINLHGSHLPTEELASGGRLVYLETDPVDVQIDLFNGKTETIDYLSPHCAFFTYGENFGNTDCRVPVSERFRFIPTRQPVVLEFWPRGSGLNGSFTTIGNWRQPWREFTYQGEIYRWSKHLEFQKFLDLPARTKENFELALSSFTMDDRELLTSKGWRVRSALELSTDPDIYRRYITESLGEFTVAKDQNVRLRSGWFSDRAVTYLAAGRPVVTQETGFRNHLPVGKGLFGFSTLEEAAEAINAIKADYPGHSDAARGIAQECFDHGVVLTSMLNHLGLSRPSHRAASIPPQLVVMPVSRWPTRLPESTLEFANALPVPSLNPIAAAVQHRVSVIMVLHNGVAYTKMCLWSLLTRDWPLGDELILVDNASNDGTAAYLSELKRRHPWIQVITNPQNRGFAAANNQAIAQATGDVLLFLNADTLVLKDWRNRLIRWLEDESVGMVGPVTNRTCNEAQIEVSYRTYEELEEFAARYTLEHEGEANPIPMLAMFCVAMRRDVCRKVGPLDERFEVGMFEDDDYARRVRQLGMNVICAEDVFVHHFGQGSFGELCQENAYDQILENNRRRFEEKWGTPWLPHGRRMSPEYRQLQRQIQTIASAQLPAGSTVAVISKGDDELIKFEGQRGWHFPQASDGTTSFTYPADGREAIAQLEALRAKGARFLLIPKPALWWLEHYTEFKQHLDARCRLALRQEGTCLIFELGGGND